MEVMLFHRRNGQTRITSGSGVEDSFCRVCPATHWRNCYVNSDNRLEHFHCMQSLKRLGQTAQAVLTSAAKLYNMNREGPIAINSVYV